MPRHPPSNAPEKTAGKKERAANGPYPAKLFVEPTTRCNFRCAMCVKQSGEASVEEGDLSMGVFERLTGAFRNLEALVLTGMGEPLLHPELEAMISLAGRSMPSTGWIGFQTNGALLDPARARSLIEAGTHKICVSVDSLSPVRFRSTRSQGELAMVERALRTLDEARTELGAKHMEIGIELVLMKRNFDELPGVIEWAAKGGASFVIVSQLLAYHESMQEEVLWQPVMDAAVDLFARAREKARGRGVDLRDYFRAKANAPRKEEDRYVVELMGDVISEAYRRDVFFHVQNLIDQDEALTERVSEVFGRAEEKAVSEGLELRLPALMPRFDRSCEFVEGGSAFVSWQGRVHPCRFLWHRYSCYLNGERKPVEPRSFGDLSRQEMVEIWRSSAFVEFREAVLEYDYPHCGNCNVTPCDLITDETFEQDCHGSVVPCGHCPWAQGLLRCLS